jgi:hypothetical protein
MFAAAMRRPDDGTLDLESDVAEHSTVEVDAPPVSGEYRRRGDRIGRYEIDGELGAGGMGIVYAATDTVLGRRVALKLVRPDRGGDGGSVRLVREAQSSRGSRIPTWCRYSTSAPRATTSTSRWS